MANPKAVTDQVLSHVVRTIESYKSKVTPSSLRPFILGLTGLQGSGKSTWAASLVDVLNKQHGYKVITVSLDDFYHNHNDLVKARESDITNKLLRTRGQPGTHDTELAHRFFRRLQSQDVKSISIPSFDKSQHNGEGDRVPEASWRVVSTQPSIEVVIFEGWCVGFQPLSGEELEKKWMRARDKFSGYEPGDKDYSTTTLQTHSLSHLKTLNDNLAEYCSSFMGPSHFDYLIHLDTDDLVNVYRWRIDQEMSLRKEKGVGMKDTEVIRFVQGYMPSYELYLDTLRQAPFLPAKDWNEGKKNHLRVVLDKSRSVTAIEEL